MAGVYEGCNVIWEFTNLNSYGSNRDEMVKLGGVKTVKKWKERKLETRCNRRAPSVVTFRTVAFIVLTLLGF